MRLLLELQDNEYLLTLDQASALVNIFADAQVRRKHYSLQAGYKTVLEPAPTGTLEFVALDDATYEAMVLATKLHNPDE